jgi:hypothetical protein
MSGRGRLRLAGILATLLATVTAVFGVGGAPASAHSNGRALVLVREFTLTPSTNGWTADVVAADFDSGAPLRNTAVTLTAGEAGATGPAAPAAQTAANTTPEAKTAKTPGKAASKAVAAPAAAPVAAAPPTITLAPTSVVGDYQGELTNAKPGPNHLDLKIRTAPSGDPVAPFEQTWDVNLVAGQPFKIVGDDDGGGGGSNLGLILGVAGGVVGVALLYGLFAARRRPAVPPSAAAKVRI